MGGAVGEGGNVGTDGSALSFRDMAGGAGLFEVGFAGGFVAFEGKDGLVGFNNLGAESLGGLGVSEPVEGGGIKLGSGNLAFVQGLFEGTFPVFPGKEELGGALAAFRREVGPAFDEEFWGFFGGLLPERFEDGVVELGREAGSEEVGEKLRFFGKEGEQADGF